ncbi:MAG: hypothetical protein GVY06_08025 [Alphaproteobacteria bacterium]|jgi:hypothetical protein|nr:hypothetical protein [Alphaproteobacteria bacterium]
MSKGTFFHRSWMIGAIAAVLAAAFAVNCTMNGGLSVRTGHVEMVMSLTPDQGLDIRFVTAAQS